MHELWVMFLFWMLIYNIEYLLKKNIRIAVIPLSHLRTLCHDNNIDYYAINTIAKTLALGKQHHCKSSSQVNHASNSENLQIKVTMNRSWKNRKEQGKSHWSIMVGKSRSYEAETKYREEQILSSVKIKNVYKLIEKIKSESSSKGYEVQKLNWKERKLILYQNFYCIVLWSLSLSTLYLILCTI